MSLKGIATVSKKLRRSFSVVTFGISCFFLGVCLNIRRKQETSGLVLAYGTGKTHKRISVYIK